VNTIDTALSRSNDLKVHLLIDCLRGTRLSKQQSSATLLLPLVQKYPNQVQVSLYHTPDLNGLLKKALPQRFNEGIGLMHLKVYGFDNDVILSGWVVDDAE
jgi:CDP-diacylglycerol--glycerol-3-phosphate 3-phosphatidyltransferase